MLSVLIPAFDEAESIASVVNRVRQTMDASGLPYEVLVVDDGSTDDTGKRAEEAGARVIRHARNGGYGCALKSGIRQARYEWCAIVDADGSYPVERLPDLVSHTPAFDMVVGARTGPHYWGSPRQRLARSILLRLVRFVAGTSVPDVNSGFRVFRRELALAHSSRISSGFSFTTTLTLAMILDERFVHYLPIDYHERVGETKVRLWRDTLRMLQILVQAILYYNPLKAFLAICIVTAVAGLVVGAVLYFLAPGLGIAFFGVALLVAVLVGAVGFLAETMRLHRTEARSRQ